jgi:hypothetical protein
LVICYSFSLANAPAIGVQNIGSPYAGKIFRGRPGVGVILFEVRLHSHQPEVEWATRSWRKGGETLPLSCHFFPISGESWPPESDCFAVGRIGLTKVNSTEIAHSAHIALEVSLYGCGPASSRLIRSAMRATPCRRRSPRCRDFTGLPTIPLAFSFRGV